MSEALLVEHCAPTMAGLKTGSMFACPKENKKTLNDSIRDLNRRLVPRGLRILPVKAMKNRVLIYVYRPGKLCDDLQNGTAREILSGKQYPVENPGRCVSELVRRMQQENDFPHEIGLFLGYPAEDVSGFLRLGGKAAKCTGIWKVYGNEEAAMRTFSAYRKCTRLYRSAYQKHRCLDRLVVTQK